MNHDNEAVNAFQQYFRPGLHLSSHLDTWMVAWSMQQQKIEQLEECIHFQDNIHDSRFASCTAIMEHYKKLVMEILEANKRIYTLEDLLREARQVLYPEFGNIPLVERIDKELGGKE